MLFCCPLYTLFSNTLKPIYLVLHHKSKKLRHDASDAQHEKQLLEQERFDKLFGSLEQINEAFATSFAQLSRDGEADLRYSREQLTLFKVKQLDLLPIFSFCMC